ncbi:type II secretion system protein [Pseudomonas sp. zfem003]|uniref:type II secretion system protein n=1 Tax=Pseudomonas sp. zfem003 TaxID=3078198 RepID=UPI00292A2D5F|nr:type II secretion system protein [Pseudomonas sp. zfem003]MDU9398719.1 type II secretion system protein [Pseudomonas sp. zfem003]
MKSVSRRPYGFTYIELVVSLAIISLIASLCFPLMMVQREREKERELRRALREIRMAIDAYKLAYEDGRILRREGEYGYPHSLEELVAGVEDASTPAHQRIYFLRRIPRNPMMPADTPSTEQWRMLRYTDLKEVKSGVDEIYDIESPFH